jgi:spore germination cell wall hydrolase CwlJ-like protein
MRREDKSIFESLPDVHLMALTIFGEAEGERFAGKLAVGFVIQNRAGLWGKSIRDVCLSENQFECFNEGNPRLPILLRIVQDPEGSMSRLKESLTAAKGVMAGTLLTNVGRATFYKAISCETPWFDKAEGAGTIVKVAEVGKHEFFEESKYRAA